MKIALGSDEETPLTMAVARGLERRGMSVQLLGALADGDDAEWPEVGRSVAELVARGDADQGVLFYWTGTGVSIAANKVPGVRAALCTDAATASGARQWNDANVLVMGLRLTSGEIATEILAPGSPRLPVRVKTPQRWPGLPPSTSHIESQSAGERHGVDHVMSETMKLETIRNK